MKQVILDTGNAADQQKLINRLLRQLGLAIRGIRIKKQAGTGMSAGQPGTERQAQANKARHEGEACAAIRPTQFFR